MKPSPLFLKSLAVSCALFLNLEFLWTSATPLPSWLSGPLYASMLALAQTSHSIHLNWLGLVDLLSLEAAIGLVIVTYELKKDILRSLQLLALTVMPLGVEVYFFSPSFFTSGVIRYGPSFLTNEVVIFSCAAAVIVIQMIKWNPFRSVDP